MLTAIQVLAISLVYSLHYITSGSELLDLFTLNGLYPVVLVAALLLFTLFMAFVSMTFTVQRLHDMNLNNWLVLLWFPITTLDTLLLSSIAYLATMIVLRATPGSREADRYGEDPLTGTRPFP